MIATVQRPRYFELTCARLDGTYADAGVYPEAGRDFRRSIIPAAYPDWHITRERELSAAEVDLLASAGELPGPGMRTNDSCAAIVARIKRHRAKRDERAGKVAA